MQRRESSNPFRAERRFPNVTKKLLLVAGIFAGFTAIVRGQQVWLDNTPNTGNVSATSGGRIFMPNLQLFDGINYNLGVVVYGGPNPSSLSPMGTFTASTDPKGYTGADLGIFQLGPALQAVTVPGVAPGGTAWIQLQIWYDGVGGLYPSYNAAATAGGLVSTVLFQNPTGNPNAGPPVPPYSLIGMPSVVLGGNPLYPPVFTQQPQNQTVMRGGTATFSVTVQIPSGMSYVWQFNGIFLPSATNSVLVITNVQPTNGGTYSVVACNWADCRNSSNAVLTVVSSLLITSQPQGLVGYWGGTAVFNVGVLASPAPSFQWFKDGFPISWGTNAVLTLSNLDFGHAGAYSVAVTNLYGSTNSASALLVVNPAGVGLGMHPFLSITGTVGKSFGIQYTTEVSQTNSWTTLTNFTLVAPVQEWIDTSVDAMVTPRRFYRVVPIP